MEDRSQMSSGTYVRSTAASRARELESLKHRERVLTTNTPTQKRPWDSPKALLNSAQPRTSTRQKPPMTPSRTEPVAWCSHGCLLGRCNETPESQSNVTKGSQHKRSSSETTSMKKKKKKKPPKQSPLMRLPPEIRLQILRIVLDNDPRMRYAMEHTALAIRTFGLNRTLHEEISEILYRKVLTRLSVQNFNFDRIIAWLQRIGPIKRWHLAHNPNLHITLKVSHDDLSWIPLMNASVARWTAFCGSGKRDKLNWHYDLRYMTGMAYSSLQRRIFKDVLWRLSTLRLRDRSGQIEKMAIGFRRLLAAKEIWIWIGS